MTDLKNLPLHLLMMLSILYHKVNHTTLIMGCFKGTTNILITVFLDVFKILGQNRHFVAKVLISVLDSLQK